MRTFLRGAMLAVGFVLLTMGSGSTQVNAASPWQADLGLLRSKLVAMHPNPFRRVEKARFDAEADRLSQSFHGMSREQAIVGTMRLVAMLGDGHTSVLPG